MQTNATSRVMEILPLAPNPPAHFEGRQEQLTELTAVLKTKDRTVVVLQGMGGIGKTAVALKLASDLQGRFPGGIFWCSLPDNQGNLQPILRHWGRACGQDLPGDIEPIELITEIRNLLQERRITLGPTLFIIDDVRREWHEASQKLLDVCPQNTAILITLRDERAAPAEAMVYRLDVPAEGEALQLLEKYGGDQVREIIEANRQDAEALLAEVGSLPLAIELLGSYLKRISRKPGFQLHDVYKLFRNDELYLGLENKDGLFSWEGTRSIAWGDYDQDGDLDLALGNSWNWCCAPGTDVAENPFTMRGGPLGNNPPFVRILSPGGIGAANYYHSAVIRSSQIPIECKLFDNEGDWVSRITVEFSPDGGGTWETAKYGGGDGLINLKASPGGTEHTFIWNAEKNLVKNDNVVIRINAQPSVGPIQRAYFGTQSFPIRVEAASWFAKVVDENNQAVD